MRRNPIKICGIYATRREAEGSRRWITTHEGKRLIFVKKGRYKGRPAYFTFEIRANKNPRTFLKSRSYKAAVKVAEMLYKHFKMRGVPSWMMRRVSPKIRPIVTDILEYNSVKVRRA